MGHNDHHDLAAVRNGHPGLAEDNDRLCLGVHTLDRARDNGRLDLVKVGKSRYVHGKLQVCTGHPKAVGPVSLDEEGTGEDREEIELSVLLAFPCLRFGYGFVRGLLFSRGLRFFVSGSWRAC